MQKRKKQLLGLAGLVLVGAMTAVACALPSPGASAVDDSDKTDGIGIKVTVGEEQSTSQPSVNISSVAGESTNREPNNPIITTDKKVSISLSYRRATSVTVQVKDVKGNVIATAVCENVSFSESSQTCNTSVDLTDEYINKNIREGDNLVVEAVAERQDTGVRQSDTYSFIYRSAYIYTKDEHDQEAKNPIIYAVANSDIKYAFLEAFDANGNKVVLKEVIEFSYADIDPVTGLYKITLPFKENNLPAGKYTVVMMAYGSTTPSEGSLLSVSTITVVYDPEGVLPPDTGSRFLGDLNISQADYILTGLVAFGLVTMFAVFLIVRRNKR